MAVANKARRRAPKLYIIKDEGSQEIHIMAARGGLTVQADRELEAVKREFTVIQGRMEHLTNEAIQAPDDKTYQSKLNYVKKFEKNFADLAPKVIQMLLLVISDWDLCLTEEDEAASLTVPLTPEGMEMLERGTVFDVFNKLMEAFAEDAEEKKEPGASPTDNGTQATVSMESARQEQSTTS